ncbi:hypothetical protein PG994_004553 [Apiospora phragmitis]|uniref:Uncharacterized protein n=1 Tax=Apiospora phragmitis TaxID=2905665 RepID=A0ABR1VUS8_9PEZI
MSQHPHNQHEAAGHPGVWVTRENQHQPGRALVYLSSFLPQGQNTMPQPTDQALLQRILQQQSQMLEEMRSMRRDVNDIQEGNNRCEQKHTVSEENETLRLENHDLQNECEKLRQLNQQLQHKNGEYADLLIKSPGDHVMDQDVITRFKDLRNAIYGAVTEVWAPKLKEMLPPVQASHKSILHDLVGSGPYNVARSQNHICKIVLETLIKHIFGRPIFGHYHTQGPATDFLRQLEQYFIDTVPHAMKGLWRKLGPVTHEDARVDGLAKDRVRQICGDAFELKLLMRKAEDRFEVRDFPGQPMTGVADFVVKFGEEPCDAGDLPETVAFSKFGALLKYPIGEGHKNPILLEKAHAVVYAKTPK